MCILASSANSCTSCNSTTVLQADPTCVCYAMLVQHYTDNGLQLYQWNGTQAGVFEKRQGQEIVNSIKYVQPSVLTL
jgi:hypothetical protein